MSTETIQAFFDTWSLYDRVLDRNYMFHEEILGEVGNLIRTRCQAGAYRLLDLGCGSARHLAGVLRTCPPSLYVGYDLSVTALGQARANLSEVNCPVDLRQADLLNGIRSRGEPFQVIFSSFAVHHLSSAEKEQFFVAARARLAPGGFVILVDVARDPVEDRPAYLDHYCDWIRSSWTDLSTAEHDHIFDHIRNHDYPESGAVIHSMAAAGGFERCTHVSSHRWHHTWLLEAGSGGTGSHS